MHDATEIKGKWITFRRAASIGKTERWLIVSENGGEIGAIRWYGPWRRYCFLPLEGTVYEEQCLREIADFCERLTKAHKAAAKSAALPT
jgi:hypothetical protein